MRLRVATDSDLELRVTFRCDLRVALSLPILDDVEDCSGIEPVPGWLDVSELSELVVLLVESGC